MNVSDKAAAGQFCWIDLAARDADAAHAFYGQMFGWAARAEPANGGSFTRLQLDGTDVGSMYQLGRKHLDFGVPSHWTPYVRVDSVEAAMARAVGLGAEAIVRPFEVSRMARIALVFDPSGAPIGLWEPLATAMGGDHGAS